MDTSVNESQIAFKCFRTEEGEFGITITSANHKFDTGPFNTFEETQNALKELMASTIAGNAERGQRVGINKIVLTAVPCSDRIMATGGDKS